jgi:hypothetical protein
VVRVSSSRLDPTTVRRMRKDEFLASPPGITSCRGIGNDTGATWVSTPLVSRRFQPPVHVGADPSIHERRYPPVPSPSHCACPFTSPESSLTEVRSPLTVRDLAVLTTSSSSPSSNTERTWANRCAVSHPLTLHYHQSRLLTFCKYALRSAFFPFNRATTSSDCASAGVAAQTARSATSTSSCTEPEPGLISSSSEQSSPAQRARGAMTDSPLGVSRSDNSVSKALLASSSEVSAACSHATEERITASVGDGNGDGDGGDEDNDKVS